MTTSLPVPKGWKVLVEKPKAKEKTAGGIYLADISKEAEDYLSITAKVVSVGPMCWYDKETGKPWIGGAWAQPGDWVLIPKFTSFRMEINDKEYRLLNDDEIIATIDDPKGIKVYT